jgi:cell fate (sporulation/competence/biofilm development) regulator YlbF (YheA/YmcA/DUF963 family)
MAIKADHMYMILKQSKQNIKTHHSASKDYTQTMGTQVNIPAKQYQGKA